MLIVFTQQLIGYYRAVKTTNVSQSPFGVANVWYKLVDGEGALSYDMSFER